MKFFKTFIFFSFFINLFSYAFSTENISTPEDIEIEKIQETIRTLQLKVYELELRKKQKALANIEHKKVGVVLSGGGAKGFAHIGVLRELEKNGIKIDYITGTSMGAVIATLYSIGYTPDEIEKLIFTIDIPGIMNAKPDRTTLPLEQKLGVASQLFSIKYDENLNFSLPKGLNNSNVTYLKLKNLLWKAEGIRDFDKLPIPLRIVATDLDTGKGVAFKEGDLAQVLTASVAIPTLMTPARIGDKLYVDGMIARNFPVQDIVDMGADIIIGSDVGIELTENRDHNIVSIFNQLLAFYSTNSTPQQKKLATFVITPDIRNFSPVDFNEADKIIHAGEVATKDMIDEILTITPADLDGSFVVEYFPQGSKNPEFLFKKLAFTNEEEIPFEIRELLKETFKEYENRKLTKEDIELIFTKLNSLDFIENIYYLLDFEEGMISVDIGENPSNSLIVGANYRSDYGTTFNLSTNILKSGKSGSLTNLSLKFGDYLGAELSNLYYYGITNKIGFFSSMAYDESPLFLYNNNSKKAKYIVENANIKLGVSSQLMNRVFLAYGLAVNTTKLDLDIGSSIFEGLQYNKQFGDAFFNINYDTIDNQYFPTSGTKGTFTYTWGGTFLNDASEINYHGFLYELNKYYRTTKKLSLSASLAGGFIQGDSILIDKYIKVGGNRNNIKRSEFSFAGYHYQSKLTEHAMIGKLGLQYIIRPNLYFNAQYNIGTFKENEVAVDHDRNDIWKTYDHGFQLGLSYDSFFGPLSLYLSTADKSAKDLLIQFNLGYYLD